MAVAIDTPILTLLFDPLATPPRDPSTGKPVERATERVAFFIEQMEAAETRILIPAPVLAEFLVIADESGPDYLAEIMGRSVFQVVDFDAMAAVEAAVLQRKAIKAGNKKANLHTDKQCLKVDRQIVAIAKTRDADAIYTCDKDIRNIANDAQIQAVMLWEMAVPAETQPELPMNQPPDEP